MQTVTSHAEYPARLGRYVTQLEDVRRVTLRYVEGLDEAALSWTPQDNVESIGTLLLHIAAVERSWIGEDIGRVPMGQEWMAAFPIRFDLKQISGQPLTHFTAKLDTVRNESLAILRGLDDDDLSRMIEPLDNDGSDQSFSIEWILYHLIEHEAHHRGQIALMKRLYEAHDSREA